MSGVAVEFNLAARDILLVYFFTTIGGHGTAMANMAAVTQHYGPSHIAFIVVPLVCAFFIDLVNAVLIP